MLTRFLFLTAGMVLWTNCADTTQTQDPELTVNNICASLPHILCDGRRAVCDETGITGDDDTCLAREYSLCEENAREVQIGKMSFFAEYVTECKRAMHALPVVADYELGESILVHTPCAWIFQGRLQIGEECERDAQCIQPSLDNSYARCSRWQRCELIRELTMGEICEVDSDGNHLCGPGLGCVVPNMSARQGTCTPSIALGEPCLPHTDFYLCGREGQCDLVTETCVRRLTTGERCYFSSQCLSGHCLGDYCAPDSTMYNGFECGVPCLGDLCQ